MAEQVSWLLTEEQFNPAQQLQAETNFTQNNGYITQRGCFEEFNSGNTLKGTYLKDVFASEQLSNLPDWTSIIVRLNTDVIDLCTCEIISYSRILNKNEGTLTRNFTVKTPAGHSIEVNVFRFLSYRNNQIAAIRYNIKSIDFQGNINFTVVIDGSLRDKAQLEKNPEWNVLQVRTKADVASLWLQTRKTNFHVCEALCFEFYKNNSLKKINATKIEKSNVVGYSFGVDVVKGEYLTVYKYVAFADSNLMDYRQLTENTTQSCLDAKAKGWEKLLEESKNAKLNSL